jgi:hypothetical protein
MPLTVKCIVWFGTQASDCNIPGRVTEPNTCFFDKAAWDRIWAAEAAAGKSKEQLTPRVTVEESEWAINGNDLTGVIGDAKLMATKLLPGEHARWCDVSGYVCFFNMSTAGLPTCGAMRMF